ncbi:hypothetical protein ACFRQM_48835 [Streptomyces sp. NPDC056831]|uniref:hypothetical protein n=1 Tax=Streptomyces sp. NPDC056831 TaxID=3345954 RepID=UPI0036BFB238
MKKKFAAAAGITLGGLALAISTQGSAQAAAPVAEFSAQVSAKQTDDVQPQAIGGLAKLAGKAAVHVKAACPSVAGAAGKVAGDFLGSRVTPAEKVSNVNEIDTVFDK